MGRKRGQQTFGSFGVKSDPYGTKRKRTPATAEDIARAKAARSLAAKAGWFLRKAKQRRVPRRAMVAGESGADQTITACPLCNACVVRSHLQRHLTAFHPDRPEEKGG